MRRVAAVLVLASFICTGCGAERIDPSEAPTTDAPATDATPSRAPAGATVAPAASADLKAAFISRANAICREAEQRVGALSDPTELSDVPGWLRSFIAILDQLQAELRAIELPPADAPDLDNYLDGNDEQVAALKAALPEVDAGARSDDQRRVDDALEKAFGVFGGVAAEQEPFVQAYGFTDCGEDPPDRATA